MHTVQYIRIVQGCLSVIYTASSDGGERRRVPNAEISGPTSEYLGTFLCFMESSHSPYFAYTVVQTQGSTTRECFFVPF